MKLFFLKNKNGFSLTEVIITISIITVAFFAIIQIFPFSLKVNKRAQNTTTAVYLAQSGIERALSLPYDDLNVGVIEPKAKLSDDSGNFLYHFQREITVEYVDENLQTNGSDTGLKKIEVNIFWNDPATIGEKSYTLTTLISKR